MKQQHVFFVKNSVLILFFHSEARIFNFFLNFTCAISFPRLFICDNFQTVVKIPSIGELFRTFERYDGDNVFSPLTIRI